MTELPLKILNIKIYLYINKSKSKYRMSKTDQIFMNPINFRVYLHKTCYFTKYLMLKFHVHSNKASHISLLPGTKEIKLETPPTLATEAPSFLYFTYVTSSQ